MTTGKYIANNRFYFSINSESVWPIKTDAVLKK